MTVTLYNYDPNTGELLSSHTAEVSPLDKVPVIMAFSTTKIPPVVTTNQRAVFLTVDGDVPTLEANGTWSVVSDYRGQAYWDSDGIEHVMTILGESIPDDSTLTKPEDSLEVLKIKKLKEIKDARNSHEFGTFIWEGHEFDCNQLSQQRFVIAVLGAQQNPTMTFEWKLADNSLITLSASDLISVVTTMGLNTEYVFNHANSLETLVHDVTTKEELENIVW